MGGDVFVKTGDVVFQEGRVTERALAVRAALGVHLEQAQIHSELDLLFAILPFEPADDNLPWLVFPIVQQTRYVEIHGASMPGMTRQVNGRASQTGGSAR